SPPSRGEIAEQASRLRRDGGKILRRRRNIPVVPKFGCYQRMCAQLARADRAIGKLRRVIELPICNLPVCQDSSRQVSPRPCPFAWGILSAAAPQPAAIHGTPLDPRCTA
ncbi:MAG TPA: hypothetical protein VMB34_31900, partial [Acetobacteraceae bacterium]|nr:hypothetical protein [Acetobacteraceae bacterium]